MLIKQKLIPLQNEQEWYSAIAEMPHAPAHLPSYQKALAISSGMPTYLYVAQADNFRAVCPIAIRQYKNSNDIITPYGCGGFISQGSFTNFFQEWNNFSSQMGWICGHISLHPAFNSKDLFPSETVFPGNEMYLLDLQKPLEQILSEMDSTHRYCIRQWQKDPVTIITEKSALKSQLYTLYNETVIRVKASPVYHFKKQMLDMLIESTNSLLVAASVNGEIEAILLFLYTDTVAEYFLSASNKNGQRHTRGLIWEGIKQLKNLQVPLLNLGAGAKTGDSLCDFKRRFGGVSSNFSALKQVYNEEIYRKFCAENKISHTVREGYFPPYWKPKIDEQIGCVE